MSISLRADRAIFKFSGPEAHKLLNDVVTGHIPTSSDIAAWWALLSPQGKILAEGMAGWADDALWLDVHAAVADDFFKRLKMYRLRAKAEIEDLRVTHRLGYAEGPSHLAHRQQIGPVNLGWRLIAPVEQTTDWADDKAYASARIRAGICELGQDFEPNQLFAHDIAMDILGGIDFAKGCYVGQEVVSRMKHRGTARRRPVLITNTTAPSGTPVMANGREAGTLGRVLNHQAVAILRLDRLTDPTAITAADTPTALAVPDWATYQLGDSTTEQ
ncbi:folate-binding protein [Devosia algicola]|uniref:Folate-binding protein n=1 Tax=Devosia algicola TaxID=3026418 RepID=A0ABY7YSD2_9HYPH|nr:folate-binding protein [Devosia algicola]WDR04033.1 folate-binding protein [Devosia algicola]